jgi:hypothetical protein
MARAGRVAVVVVTVAAALAVGAPDGSGAAHYWYYVTPTWQTGT